jgi:hypothetical protein
MGMKFPRFRLALPKLSWFTSKSQSLKTRLQSQREKKKNKWRSAIAAMAVLILVTIGPVAYFVFHHPDQAQAAWFDNSWGFRQRIPLSNSSGSTQTDFQVQVTIDTSTLITAGKLQSACQDVRFTSLTGKALPYWIEPSTCNTTTTKVWVKVDSIASQSSGATSDIFFYYGNASASTTSATTPTFMRDMTAAAVTWPLDDTTSTQSYSRVQNATVSAGRNLVIDPGLDDATKWTGSGSNGWLISGSLAAHTSGSSGSVSQSNLLTIGKAYSVTFTTSGITGGTLTPFMGSSGGGTAVSTNGTFTQTIIASGNTTFSLSASSFFAGNVDNVIVTQINIPSSSGTVTNLLTDGNMETAGTAAWTAGSSTLSKQSGTPHGGSQVLRIARISSVVSTASQNILTTGQVYRVTGYARSDGTATPAVSIGAGANSFVGTTSTSWQPFDFIVVATGAALNLNTQAASGTPYAEFDDIVVTADTTVRTGEISQDGDMEASGTTYWPSLNSATITKDTTSPHGGTQNLRIARNGVNSPQTRQSTAETVVGKTYRITGYTKSDGTAIPVITDTSVGTLWTGTTSTSWQLFDVIRVIGTDIRFGSSTSTGTTYVEFDDISITEVDPLVGLPTNGVTLGTAVGASGHLTTGYTFDGTNDVVNTYSSDLNSVMNASEGSVVAWAKVSGSGVWSDATNRHIFYLSDGVTNNDIDILKTTTTNQLRVEYFANATTKTVTDTSLGATTGWFQIVITWSKSSDQVKMYLNGAQVGSTQTGLGTWNANVSSTQAAIGAKGSGGTQPWSGMINDVRLYTRPLSETEIAALYSTGSDIQAYQSSNYLGHELLRKYNDLVTVGSAATEEVGSAPTAYWKFDDGTGTTAKNSGIIGTNNNGTLTNFASPPSATSGWQTEDQCISGKCLRFDGTDDSITAGTNILGPKLNGSSSITLSAWLKPTAYPGAGARRRVINILMNSGASTGALLGLNDTTGSIEVGGRSQSGDSFQSTTFAYPSLNQWHHVIGVLDFANNQIKIYLDGQLVKTTTVTFGSTTYVNNTPTSADTIGSGSGADFFQGTIDEPKIYTYARSAAQVKSDYIAGAARAGSSSVQGSQSQGALSNGLVGYWKMDETSWTVDCSTTSVLDSSGNGNNGKSCPTSTGPAGGAAGKFGNGGSFDGSDDRVVVPRTTALEPTTQVTLSAWVNASAFASPGRIFFKSDNSGNAVYSLDTNSTTVRFVIRNSSSTAVTVSSSTTLSTSTWYHLVGTYDGTTANLYINGRLDSSGSLAGPLSTYSASRDLGIGAVDTGSQFWNGKIDEARIYNRALSSDEVRQLYTYAPSPVGYWKFDEKTGTTTVDSSGNGNTGTLANSPTFTTGKYGGGVLFNNTTSNISSSANINSKGSGTFELWFKPNFTGAPSLNKWLFDYYQNASNRVGLFIDQSLVVHTYFVVGGVVVADAPFTFSPTAGTWYHIAGIVNADTGKTELYFNGQLKSSISTTSSLNFSSLGSATTYIGHFDGGVTGYSANGTIDDVRVYNYARTASQIQEDMRGSVLGANSVVSGVGGDTASTQPASALGYWKFDEGQGTVANNSGNGGSALNGTLSGMASPATSTSGWSNAGKVGKSLSFDTTNDYVDIGTSSSLDMTQFTISLWWKAGASGSAWGGPFQNRLASKNGFQVVNDTNSTTVYTPHLVIWNGTSETFHFKSTTTYAYPFAAYKHFVWTYDGTNAKLYVDGVSQPVVTSAITGYATTGALIGRGYAFDGGNIDEVKLFNFPLSSDQVRSEYNLGASVNYGTGTALESSTLTDGTGNDPVGEWKFEEKNGTTVNDTSGSANTGTWNGSGTAHWTPGKYGAAGKFDGTTDYVNISPALTTLPNSTTFSLSAWYKSTSTTASQYILAWGSGSSNTPYMAIILNRNVTTGEIAFEHRDDASTNQNNTFYRNASLIDGKWHHVEVIRSSASTYSLYIDGILQNTSTTISPSTTTTTKTCIGALCRSANTQFFNGSIDEVKVYNYARTAAQVAYDYNRGGPIGWWKMDECQGTTINDSSGQGNTGTLTVGATGTQTAAGTCNTSGTVRANGATGKFNNSLNFDGTDDFATITDANNIYQITGDLSVSSWIKTSSATAQQMVISKGSTTDWLYSLFVNSGKALCKIYQQNSTSAYLSAQSTQDVNDGSWHMVTCSLVGTTLTTYVDGKVAATSSSTTGTRDTASSGSLYIGNFSNSGNSLLFPGQIDDVRIFNYGLSAAQIQKLYNNGGAVNYGPSTGSP